MEGLSIVIMEREASTGFLSKELGSFDVGEGAEFIDRIFAVDEDGKKVINMYLSAPGEYEDWEYNALLDNYNTEIYEGRLLSIDEDEDSYNPGWILRFEFKESHDEMEKDIREILTLHDEELKRAKDEIKGLKGEYTE